MAALFGVTPFGIYCRECNNKVGSSKKAITDHLALKHRVNAPENIDSFRSHASNEMKRLTDCGNFEQCLLTKRTGYACQCGRSYNEKCSLNKHCRLPNCSCDERNAMPEMRHTTTCGRIISETESLECKLISSGSLDNPNGSNENTTGPVPPPREPVNVDFGPTKAFLSEYMRNDEDVGPFTGFLHPLQRELGDNFESTLKDMVGWWHDTETDQELGLQQALQSGKNWLHTARHHVDLTPGNARAALQVFEGQEIGDVSQNYLCHFRHKESLLWQEVRRLIRHIYRCDDELVSQFKLRPRADDFSLLPNILSALFSEKVDGVLEHPLIVKYCVARAFRLKRGELHMPQCGDTASAIAATMSILRAACCSRACIYNFSDAEAELLVQELRRGRPINIMAPGMRKFREMQRRKGKSCKKTIAIDGDISVDGFSFPRETWSHLIPSIIEVCRDLLHEIFEKDLVDAFLDTQNPAAVARNEDGSFDFSVFRRNRKISCADFVLKNIIEQDEVIERLTSHVEVAFHGLGGGSTRETETHKLLRWNAIWHRGTFYCNTSSDKCFSYKSRPTGKEVEHKLPPTLARIFLLLAITSDDHTKLIPHDVNNRSHKMTDAIMELFSFSERPSATQVRQFFASVSNFQFPDGWDAMLTATPEAAEKLAHNYFTHKKKHGNELIGGSELLCADCHQALGSTDYLLGLEAELTERDLLSALRSLFGPRAEYSSNFQRDMVLAAAKDSSKHAHVGLACGAGKSMAWLLPLAAAAMHGKKIGSFSVVLPHNFLVCHQEHSAVALLDQRFDVSVASITTAECSQTSLPRQLQDDSNLPKLMFFGVDAFAALLKHHSAHITRWVSDKSWHRLICDEVHSFHSELFRSVYDDMRFATEHRVPLMTMSGAVPRSFVDPLAKYLNMAESSECCKKDVDVICCPDLLGAFPSGFDIVCKEHTRHKESVIQRVKEVLSAHPDFSIHVLCASKKIVDKISEKLSDEKFKVGSVHADVGSEDEKKIAANWREGKCDVLVSTTCALVGNDSPRCRCVFVAGYLFNLMNVAQAMGRLRPKQRVRGGSIEIFLRQRSNEDLVKFAEKKSEEGETCFNTLVAKKLLRQEHHRQFQKVCTAVGLIKWCITDKGCRMVALHERFGITGHRACGVCDRCKGTAVARTAAIAKAKSKEKKDCENIAIRVVRKLELRCLVCGKGNCTGDKPKCIGYHACLKCGSRSHQSGECTVNFPQLVGGRACSNCLDLHCRRGCERHDPSECTMQRRLRRLLIAGCEKDRRGIAFEKCCSEHLCDYNQWCRFLAAHD